MRVFVALLALAVAVSTTAVHAADDKITVLIVDGQGHHDWRATTPILKKHLEDTGLFTVDVTTSPAHGGNMNDFKPAFGNYKIVLSNYHGDMWSPTTRKAFVDYMLAGGGLIVIHDAASSFPEWPEWKQMVALSGYEQGEGASRSWLVDLRDESHPITVGLAKKWIHTPDTLPTRLIGQPEPTKILAEAYAGSEENDNLTHHIPAFYVQEFGPSNIFVMVLGHSPPAVSTLDFKTILQRGAEWVATENVTQDIPPGMLPQGE